MERDDARTFKGKFESLIRKSSREFFRFASRRNWKVFDE